MLYASVYENSVKVIHVFLVNTKGIHVKLFCANIFVLDIKPFMGKILEKITTPVHLRGVSEKFED